MGAIASIVGGGKKKGGSTPKVVEAPAKTDQAEPKPTATSAQKRNNTRQRSSLVSGRPGAATRSGINVPGRN